jgi:hypothetical protein
VIPADLLLASFEAGSALFGLGNIRAIRRDKKIAGVWWQQTAFYMGWGFCNLYIYSAALLPLSWWAGIGITLVNIAWLAHVFHYSAVAAGKSYGAFARSTILEGIKSCRASLKQSSLSLLSLAKTC